MILQALNNYYRRLVSEGLTDIAGEGFQKQPIPFVIVLKPTGRFADLHDTRVGEGKSRAARVFTVPKAVKKTSGCGRQPPLGISGLCVGPAQARSQERSIEACQTRN